MDIEIRSAKRADEEAVAILAGQLGYPSSVHEIRERLVEILEDGDQVRVRSNVIREGAHSFYERLGYCCVKQQNVYYKIINIS